MKPLLLKTLLKPLLPLSLLLVLSSLPAMADGQTNKNQASKTYDAKGKLLQKTDERGRIYDAKGSYQGKVKPVSPVKSEKRDAKGKLVEVKKTDDPGL